jgi:hypothetical protein
LYDAQAYLLHVVDLLALDVPDNREFPIEYHSRVSAEEKQHNPLSHKSIAWKRLRQTKSAAEFCSTVGGECCQRVYLHLKGEVEACSIKSAVPASLQNLTARVEQGLRLLVWFKAGSPPHSRATTPEKTKERSGLCEVEVDGSK